MYKRMLIISLAALTAIGGFFFARRHTSVVNPSLSVAEITKLDKHVRTRMATSLKWETAEFHQLLMSGDAVYTSSGAKASIILKNGALLDLSENSLVEVGDIPKLELGNLRLSLQGDLKFNLAGHTVALHGQDSQLQLYIEDPGIARLRLLSGSATLKQSGRTFDLEKDKVASLDRPDVMSGPDPILSAHTAVEAVQTLNEFFYTDKIDDLYQRSLSGNWIPRAQRDPMIAKTVSLKWKLTGLPQQIFVQLAPTRDFAGALDFTSQGEGLELNKVFLKDNFWRVSTNHHDWSESYFRVSTLPASGEPPHLRINSRRLSSKPISFPIESATAYRAYLIEVATSPAFQSPETTWVTDAKFLFQAHKAGEYFLRARGVSAAGEISEFSQMEKITVER